MMEETIVLFKIEFGKTVKRLRAASSLTQEELARKTHLHRTYISDVERGIRNVSFDSIAKLADGLGVPIGKLFIEADALLTNSSQTEIARKHGILS